MITGQRGADLVCQSLARAGTKRVFALSGNHIMSLFDAAPDAGLDILHVRHEAAAVHMADAYARSTGEIGVALLTGGPGHANGISALYTALASESPVLMLSGHAPCNQLGLGAFQEMHQAAMAAPVTKASWTVTEAQDLGREIAGAIRLAASGRPGPVHLSLPSDLLEARLADAAGALPGYDAFQATEQLLGENAARQIVTALGNARRPLILTGPYAATAAGAAINGPLREALGVPVVTMESPRGINDPCLGAFAEVLAQADGVLLLGKQPDFTLGFARPPVLAEHCRLLQIDPNAAAIAQLARATAGNRAIALSAVADTRAAAQALIASAGGADKHAAWRTEVADAIRYRPPEWSSLTSPQGIHPAHICRAVQSLIDAAPDALVVADGGEFGQWAQACLEAPRRVINGPSGAIGSAPAFAAAAALALPHTRVIALLGDGTLGFHLSELDTAVRYALPYIAVIGNDACWNAEHQIQLKRYGADRAIGCELLPTRYDEAAAGLGAAGYYVSEASQLRPALDAAAASARPACVNVLMPRVPAPVIRRTPAGSM